MRLFMQEIAAPHKKLSRADRQHMAHMTAIWWLATGGERLNNALPRACDLSQLLTTKDHGPYNLVIHDRKLHDDVLKRLTHQANAREERV